MRLTPSETTFTESISSPESVSSMIAISGSSIAICRISARFFSPPEKPSFTYRDTIAGSIFSSSIFCFSNF